MDKGRIAASQLRAIVVLASFLPFLCYFSGASGAGEAVAMAAAEWAMLISAERISYDKAPKALKFFAALYFEVLVIGAVACFCSIVDNSVTTELLPYLAAAALAVGIRAAAFGPEAVGRFSSIVLALSVPILLLLSLLMLRYAEPRYLASALSRPLSAHLIFWAAMPAPAAVYSVYRPRLAKGERAPALSAANTILIGKSAAAFLLQATMGDLLGTEKTPVLYLAEIVGAGGSPLLVCLLSLSMVGAAISAVSALLLGAAGSIGRRRQRDVLILAIPALTIALTGGLG